MSKGWSDKLYWRYDGALYHCYKKRQGGGYLSLCGERSRATSGGQACKRPVPRLRCGICDGKEMERRGWDESGPTSHPKKKPAAITIRKTKKGTSITFRGNAARKAFKAMGGKLG